MTAPAMDRSVAPSSGVFKAIVDVAIRSASAVVLLLQEHFDQRVRHRVDVAPNRIDVYRLTVPVRRRRATRGNA